MADSQSMSAFLSTYRPISATRRGQAAVASFGIPPFADASCRREPDFESPFPSISALCRGRAFAPRLHPEDVVVYLTTKGRHGGVPSAHWRLVAILRVLRRFEDHDAAAGWYRAQGLALPSNCMVEGNGPIELCRTGGPKPSSQCGPLSAAESVVRGWDSFYRQRAREYGTFLATEAFLLDLHEPTIITENDLDLFGGKMPGTQTPPRISPEVVDRLMDLARRRSAARAA